MTGAAYAIGVLIANLGLGDLGFFGSELLRSSYLTAGATWLLLFGCGSSVTLAIYHSARRIALVWRRRQLHRVPIIAFTPLIFVTLTGIVIASLRQDLSYLRYTTTWKAVFVVAVLPAVTLFIVWQFRHFTATLDRLSPKESFVSLLLSFELVIGLSGILLGGLLSYARFVYPLLPAAYGGGRPVIVSLSIVHDPEARVDAESELALSRAANRCELLAETGDWILVRTIGSSPRIVRIRRTYVVSIAVVAPKVR